MKRKLRRRRSVRNGYVTCQTAVTYDTVTVFADASNRTVSSSSGVIVSPVLGAAGREDRTVTRALEPIIANVRLTPLVGADLRQPEEVRRVGADERTLMADIDERANGCEAGEIRERDRGAFTECNGAGTNLSVAAGFGRQECGRGQRRFRQEISAIDAILTGHRYDGKSREGQTVMNAVFQDASSSSSWYSLSRLATMLFPSLRTAKRSSPRVARPLSLM